ncbi:MAG: hypothetical protein ACR2O3_16650 [Rhizobiaceae bacterium]
MAEIDLRTSEVGHLCGLDSDGYAELVKRMSFIVEVEMNMSCRVCLYKYLLQSAACVALADRNSDQIDKVVDEFLSAANDITKTVRCILEEESSASERQAVA